jgi:L-asparaginase
MERPLVVLAAGGTIAMAAGGPAGDAAVPALDAAALVAAVPSLAGRAVRARSVAGKPGAHLTAADALGVAREAAAEAAAGAGVVVTTGTDTLEELAVLCDLVSGAAAPIVLTGAIRPSTEPGADGPANLLDAAAVAAAPAAAGLGAVVVFGGEVHAAALVRKADSTSPAAFASPGAGPLGRVAGGRVRLALRPARPRPALDVRDLGARVDVVATALGDDGAPLRAAVADGADGVVLVALGAGHVGPGALRALREAAARVPVVAALRPQRGAFLHGTYGFEGSERDVRASGAIPCGALSSQAARMTLMAGLGAGLDAGGLRDLFAPHDP